MANCNFLTKAIEHVKRATGWEILLLKKFNFEDEDKAQNYPEALRLYKLSLEYFMTALKCMFSISFFSSY